MSIPELVWTEWPGGGFEAPIDDDGGCYRIFNLTAGGVELWYWTRARQECLGEFLDAAAAKAAARTHVGDDG